MKEYIVKMYGEKPLTVTADEVAHGFNGNVVFKVDGNVVAEFSSFAGYWEKVRVRPATLFQFLSLTR